MRNSGRIGASYTDDLGRRLETALSVFFSTSIAIIIIDLLQGTNPSLRSAGFSPLVVSNFTAGAHHVSVNSRSRD